jgi:AAHS family benzoate transporter-like MFS transporter
MATAANTNLINVNKWLDGAKFNSFHLRVFLLGKGIFTCDGYDLVVFGAAVPLLMRAFRIGPAQAGAIAGYALIGAAVGALVFGSLADRIGRKKTIILCASLFSICMGLTGFTNGPVTFGLLRFFMGVGIGGSMPNVIALSSEYSPGRNRTMMGGTVSGGMQIGGIAAALIAMWLFPQFGWRSVFFVGAVPLLAMPLYAKLLPESPVHLFKTGRLAELRNFLQRVRPAEPIAAEANFEISKGAGKAPIAAVFQEGRAFSTILIWIMFFMNMYIIFGFTVWLPKLMMNNGYSLGSGLFFLLTLQVVSYIGVWLFGGIADRFRARPTLVVAFLLAFVCIGLVPYTRNFVLLTILVGLAGFGFNGGQGVINGYAGSFYAPTIRSTGMGLAFAVGRLGAILGPALTGLLMSFQLSFQANMIILAAPGIIAAICILLINDKLNFARLQRELRMAQKA